MDPTHDRLKSSGGVSSETSQPIRFAGSVLGAQRHVSAFFHGPDEEYRVLLPFVKEGFERGEKPMSLSAIAREFDSTLKAGRVWKVGKTTTYRRWPNKAAVVMDAFTMVVALSPTHTLMEFLTAL